MANQPLSPPVEYDRLVEYYDRLEATTKRLELTDILVDLVRECSPDELPRVVYLTQGKLHPDFMGIELGIADKLVLRAITFTTGLPETMVAETYRERGDLGDAAEVLLKRAQEGQGRKRGPKAARQTTLFSVAGDDGGDDAADGPLTVTGVYDALDKIAKAVGGGSQERKVDLLKQLLLSASPRAARYIIRTVTGKLRLGIADMTMLDALAIAYANKQDRPALERAYNVSSDLAQVARAIQRGGLDAVSEIHLQVGVPVRAMLAERLPSAEEILDKLGGKAAVEYKYDGLRLQAHIRDDGRVQFFTRRLEEVTDQFPDVAQHLREAFQGRNAIVEGEAVAVNPETLEMRPFQEVSTRRGRKHGIAEAIQETPITIFLFDCLLAEDEDLTDQPLPKRRAALERHFRKADHVQFSDYHLIDDTDELVRYFEIAVSEGAEGIMCKSVRDDSTYRAGARGWQWIKFKRDYRTELTDTLDLVVVGALAGRGRRAGWYGALLMAAYNPEEDVFETVCKLGTGFNDEMLAAMPEMFARHKIDHPHPRVRSKMAADYWFEPALVAEVVGAELTLSPVHTAAWGDLREGAGLAVRFPRFTGNWRKDKAPEDATSTQELVEMYRAQRQEVTADAGAAE